MFDFRANRSMDPNQLQQQDELTSFLSTDCIGILHLLLDNRRESTTGITLFVCDSLPQRARGIIQGGDVTPDLLSEHVHTGRVAGRVLHAVGHVLVELLHGLLGISYEAGEY